MENENQDMITLQDEEGNEIECEIIEWFEFEDNEYIVLLPEGEEELNILRVDKDDEGNEVYAVIENDDEFDRVAEAYDELLGEDED